MKTLSQIEIQMVSGGEIDWWRCGFDITASGLVGAVAGAITVIASSDTSGPLGIVTFLMGGSIGGALGLGAGLVIGTGVAIVRETVFSD